MASDKVRSYDFNSPQYEDFSGETDKSEDMDSMSSLNNSDMQQSFTESNYHQLTFSGNEENVDPKVQSSFQIFSNKDNVKIKDYYRRPKPPTIPKTPLVVKRYQMQKKLKQLKQVMTDEEFIKSQMRDAKIKLVQKKIKAAKAKYRKVGICAKSPKKFTEAVGFNFTSNVKHNNENSEVTAATKQFNFFADLRKHEDPSFVPTRTIPVPFVFHGKKEVSSKANQKMETLAELCNKFVTRTPARFHTKSYKELNDMCAHNQDIAKRPKITIAKTPKLLTKTRIRMTDIPSQADKEQADYEEMKKNQFKATKFDKDKFSQCNIAVRKSIPKKSDSSVTIKLDKKNNFEEIKSLDNTLSSTCTTNENKYSFHAQPFPEKLFKKQIGVKPRKEIPLTIPKSPEFSELHATKKKISLPMEDQNLGIPKIGPPPPTSVVPFKPQFEHKKTEPEPFTFESRDKEMMAKKEQKIQTIYENEKAARKFVANPLPDLSPKLPHKKLKPPTKIEEFNLEVEKRAIIKHEKWQKYLDEEMKKEREAKIFIAKPPTVLTKDPFIPEKHNNSTLMSIRDEDRHVPMNLEKRAAERYKREQSLKSKQEELDKQQLEKERLRLEEEERELKRIRSEIVHVAQPVKHYKPVIVESSHKPLTLPQSPDFSDRLTSKYEKKCEK